MLENVWQTDGPGGRGGSLGSMSSNSMALSLAVLARTSGRVCILAGRRDQRLGRQVTRKPSLSISQLKCAEGEPAFGSVGGSECRSSHSSSSRQGERKHRAKRISPNPCWFFFFCGLKRSQIGAKCPSWQPNEHYAISPWLSGVWGFLFPWKASCSEMKSKWYRGPQ